MKYSIASFLNSEQVIYEDGLDGISPYRIPLQNLLMASDSVTKFWLDAYQHLKVVTFFYICKCNLKWKTDLNIA